MSSISTLLANNEEAIRNEWEKIQNHPHENLRNLSKQVEEKICKLANQEFTHSFSLRFTYLTQTLRKAGLPIPRSFPVLGVEPGPYEQAQTHWDKSLVNAWTELHRLLPCFPEKPEDGEKLWAWRNRQTADEIRPWLNDPANEGLIADTLKAQNVPDNGYILFYDLKGCLPLEIGIFTCLTNLVFDGNSLENLPSTIKKLTNLKSISLSRNRFSEFPKVLHKIKTLRKIEIHHNRITSLGPDEVFSDKEILYEGNPLFFKYNELFNTYRWYAPKPLKISSASGTRHAYVNCANYSCATSFAALCQAIHKGETSSCQEIFQNISPKIQEQILSHIPETKRPNLFTRLDLLVQALLKTVKKLRDGFDEEEHKLMRHHHLALLGIEDRSSIPNTKANVLCLIDAIILTADSEYFSEERACKKRKLD